MAPQGSPDAHESFSDVVLRARWPEPGLTAEELRAVYLAEGPCLDAAALDRIEEALGADRPPEDKRAKR